MKYFADYMKERIYAIDENTGDGVMVDGDGNLAAVDAASDYHTTDMKKAPGSARGFLMIPDCYVLCTPAIFKNIRNPLIFLQKMATYSCF